MPDPLEDVSTGDPHVAAHNYERVAINEVNESILTKVSKPSTPHVGELMRFNGTVWDASVTRLFEGSGQPEGNVAAPVGSRYVDTAGSDGAVEWLKKSGSSSNEGWMLLAGDTGVRIIEGLIDKRGTADVTSAFLRRTNDVVDLYLDFAMPTNETSPWLVLTLPSGFRPPFWRYGGLHGSNDGSSKYMLVKSSGDVVLFTINHGQRDRFAGIWTTNDPWPSSLPGIPA